MKRVGRLTYALCAATLDKMVLVNEGAVCSSILTLYNRDAIVVEPAGEWWKNYFGFAPCCNTRYATYNVSGFVYAVCYEREGEGREEGNAFIRSFESKPCVYVLRCGQKTLV